MRRRVLGLVFATTLFAVVLLGGLIVAVIWAVIRRTTGRFGKLSVAFAASTTANTVSLLIGILSER